MFTVFSCDKWYRILRPFFFFYLRVWALSLDADPLDISVPSHIRGRQTENEDKNTVSAASCQRASPSLLAAAINVSFYPDIIITLYIVSGVWRFVWLAEQSAARSCPFNWLVGNAARQRPTTAESANWEVFIFSAARRPISGCFWLFLLKRSGGEGRPLTGRNAHVDLTVWRKTDGTADRETDKKRQMACLVCPSWSGCVDKQSSSAAGGQQEKKEE